MCSVMADSVLLLAQQEAESALWTMIQSGGVIMYVIIATSLVGFGLVIERFLAYARARVRVDQIMPEIEQKVREGDLQGALDVCQRYRGVVPEVYAMAIQHEIEVSAGAEAESLGEAVQNYVRTVAVPKLRRFLRPIGLIARSAPMLGLLGTVFGMIRLFDTMATQGMGDPTKFVEGVGLALVTTAAGLLVAIPIIYCHGLLISQVESIENDVDRYTPTLLQWLRWLRVTGQEQV